MRTLTEMTERIRQLVTDDPETAAARAWDDAAVYDSIVDAVQALSEDLAMHPDGREMLLAHGSAFTLTADTEEYDLPADCLALDAVEWRQNDTVRWTEAQYRRAPNTPLGGYPRSGNATFGGAYHAPVFWDDGLPGAVFRLWPVESAVGTDEYRLRYVKQLTPPANSNPDSETLASPVWGGSPPAATTTQRATDRMVSAVEYYAAALLSMEELEDSKPIGTFGGAYRAEFRRIVKLSRPARPRRRYINMVRG